MTTHTCILDIPKVITKVSFFNASLFLKRSIYLIIEHCHNKD